MVEHRIEAPGVTGSIPVVSTILQNEFREDLLCINNKYFARVAKLAYALVLETSGKP